MFPSKLINWSTVKSFGKILWWVWLKKSLNLSDDFFCTNHQPASILHIFHQNYFVCIKFYWVVVKEVNSYPSVHFPHYSDIVQTKILVAFQNLLPPFVVYFDRVEFIVRVFPRTRMRYVLTKRLYQTPLGFHFKGPVKIVVQLRRQLPLRLPPLLLFCTLISFLWHS